MAVGELYVRIVVHSNKNGMVPRTLLPLPAVQRSETSSLSNKVYAWKIAHMDASETLCFLPGSLLLDFRVYRKIIVALP